MGRRTARVVLAALVVAVAGCGDDDGSEGTAASSATTALEGRAAAFCDAWNALFTSDDDSAIDAVLDEVPAELEEAAVVLREARADGSESPEVDAAADEVMNWAELHCRGSEPGQSRRRVAPTIAAEFDGLTFCGTAAYPPWTDAGPSGMVLYGSAGASDPYDEPMLGVAWNPADEGGHEGDGDPEPVTVRGQSGVAAPITVFQQTIVPELGTVIAWTEGEDALGLYGRGWSMDRADELVAITDRLEAADGGFRIPDDALPAGFTEVFSGSPWVTSLVVAPAPLYSLRYQGDDGVLEVTGIQMTEDEYEAFRFFTIGVDQGDVGSHEALVGNAWNAGGPAVVTWRESDGLVVRIVGIGVPLETARQVATASRELTEDEWIAVVEADDRCEDP